MTEQDLIFEAKQHEEYNNIDWISLECSGIRFTDHRLDQRYHDLLHQLWNGLGKTIPLACQDWSNTKAAYRFLSNNKVTEDKILEQHFASTKLRANSQSYDKILVIQDTTEFTYNQANADAIGFICKGYGGKDAEGNNLSSKRSGIKMHSSIAITSLGLPLGLCAVKFWSRKEFKGANALKRKVNFTRIPIEEKESYRWLENLRQSNNLLQDPENCVHIGDRESDIFELFCLAKELGTHFLVRTCVDRLADDGTSTVLAKLNQSPIRTYHNIVLYEKGGNYKEVKLSIKYERIEVNPPIGKHKKYPTLSLTVIHATEISPSGNTPIEWKLLTDLSVNNSAEAIEKLDWYAMRWKIETFHKIMKSGCRAESLKLRTAQRLTNLLAIFCIFSWRIFWMTMLNKHCPSAPGSLVFTNEEMDLLSAVSGSHKPYSEKNVGFYLSVVARLGGYLSRNTDPPPGNMVMWRGISRVADIALGIKLANNKTYG